MTWEDIDLTSGKVIINKSTQYLSKYGTFEKETKTASSDRIIYVTPLTLELLKQWKKEQATRHLQLGEKWENSKRVFTNDIGQDMQPNRPYKILQDVIKENNLKRITFHDLRHTSATLLIASGEHTQLISKRLGHSNITTTHKVYSHFIEEEYKHSADKMQLMLTNEDNIIKVGNEKGV